jgi:hypothetical protein
MAVRLSALRAGRLLPPGTFLVLIAEEGQKMKKVGFLKILVPTYQTTRCRNPGDQNMNLHHLKNIESHIWSTALSVFEVRNCDCDVLHLLHLNHVFI